MHKLASTPFRQTNPPPAFPPLISSAPNRHIPRTIKISLPPYTCARVRALHACAACVHASAAYTYYIYTYIYIQSPKGFRCGTGVSTATPIVHIPEALAGIYMYISLPLATRVSAYITALRGCLFLYFNTGSGKDFSRFAACCTWRNTR